MEQTSLIFLAEKELIGSCIHWSDTYFRSKSKLNAIYFNNPDCRQIIEAIEAIDDELIPIDPLTVKLRLEVWGAEPTTMELLNSLPSNKLDDTQIDYYIKLIVNENIRIQFLDTSTKIREISLKENASIDVMVALTEILLNRAHNARISGQLLDFKKVLQGVLNECLNQHLVKNLSFHLPQLDETTNGLMCGELILIGARPGVGKTSFLINQLINTAIHDAEPVVYFSGEMNTGTVIQKIISNLAEIPFNRLGNQNFTPEEKMRYDNAIQLIKDSPITIIDHAQISVNSIRNISKQLKTTNGIQLIIVDYLQLLKSDIRKHNREQEVNYIVSSLKSIARELDIPILIASQLSRSAEKRGNSGMPMLSDLKESGSIEETADKVIFLYRYNYYGITEYEDGTSTQGLSELIIAKNRQGPVTNLRVQFMPKFGKYAPYLEQDKQRIGQYNRPESRDDEFTNAPF